MLTAAGVERHDGSRMVAGHLGLAAMQHTVVYRVIDLERLVKLDDKIILEALGYTTAVARRVAVDGAVVGCDGDCRPLVKGVDYDVGLLGLGVGETQHGGALGGRHLGGHVIVGKIHLIVIWCRRLGLVREPAGALVLVPHGRAHCGHQRELPVVVDPRAGLVRLLEAAYLVGSVGVLPPVTVFACLRHPEVHAPRHGDGGIGVTGR